MKQHSVISTRNKSFLHHSLVFLLSWWPNTTACHFTEKPEVLCPVIDNLLTFTKHWNQRLFQYMLVSYTRHPLTKNTTTSVIKKSMKGHSCTFSVLNEKALKGLGYVVCQPCEYLLTKEMIRKRSVLPDSQHCGQSHAVTQHKSTHSDQNTRKPQCKTWNTLDPNHYFWSPYLFRFLLHVQHF